MRVPIRDRLQSVSVLICMIPMYWGLVFISVWKEGQGEPRDMVALTWISYAAFWLGLGIGLDQTASGRWSAFLFWIAYIAIMPLIAMCWAWCFHPGREDFGDT